MAKKKPNKEVKADSFESAVLEIKFVDDEPKAKEPVEEEVKAQAVEIVEELPVEEEEVVEEPKEEEKVEEAPPIPVKPPKFYHVDQFLQTAIPLFGLNAMQARGFKAKMQGKQYQEDMNIFVNELKKYLNIQ
jgi:hypothetical protein